MSCVNCGHQVVEAFCSRCGQRRRDARFSLGPLVQEAVSATLDLDSGLLRTVVDLSRRPGAMAREYLAGRTRPYTNPVKYLVICAALTTFVSIASGFAASPVDAAMSAAAGAEAEAPEELTRLLEFTQRYFNLLLIVALPLLPLLTRFFFRSSGFTFAEHLIFNTYVYAQQNLIFVALIPFYLLGGPSALAVLYSVGITAYYVWACRGFFGLGLFPTLVRGSIVMILHSIAFMAGMGIAVSLLIAG